MAICKILYINDKNSKSSSHMKQAITYILNGEKTEQKVLTGGWNLQVDKAYEQMMDTKEVFGKTDGRQGYHIIISFKEGETDAQTAMRIVERFVQEYLSDYESVYAVHDNTDHIHGHVIFNSVSFATGKKYHYKKNDWASFIQPIVNRICEEYGLSTIELDEKEVHNRYKDWNEHRDGKFVWSDMIKRDVDIAIAEAESFEEFISILEKRGYEVKQGKHLALKAPGMSRYRRCYQMGSDYTEENIKRRILIESLATYHNETLDESERIVYKWIPRNKRVKHTKLTKLQKRYFARLYRLGLLQRRPYSQVWKYKDEIRRFEQLQQEYLFLSDHNISDIDQLLEMEKAARADKKDKVSEKNKIYRSEKKCSDLFSIAEEMSSLVFAEQAFMSGDVEFEPEHDRWVSLSEELLKKGYTYDEVISIREYYRLETKRLREEVRKATQRVKIIEAIRKEYEEYINRDKISEKDAISEMVTEKDVEKDTEKYTEKDIATQVISELLNELENDRSEERIKSTKGHRK